MPAIYLIKICQPTDTDTSFKSSASFVIQLEDLLHEAPLLGGGHGGVAAMEAGDVGFPLCLAGQGGETR